MKERFNGAFIAIPIADSPLLNWVRSLNKHKKFFHMTMYFLGEIDEDQLENIKSMVKSDPQALNGTKLQPVSLGYIGPDAGTFVVKLKPSEQLSTFRTTLEKGLYQFSGINLPFIPHITIRKSRDVNSYNLSGDINQDVLSYFARSVGVYYKTEEGATALLYTQKVQPQ